MKKILMLFTVIMFVGIVLVGCGTEKEVIDNEDNLGNEELKEDNKKTAETMVPPNKEDTAEDILVKYQEAYKSGDYETMVSLISEESFRRNDLTAEDFIKQYKELDFKNEHKLTDYMISTSREIDDNHVYFKLLYKVENNGIVSNNERDLVVLKENGEWKIDMNSRFKEEELDLLINDGNFVIGGISVIKAAREYGEDTLLDFDIGSTLPVVSLKFNYNTMIEIHNEEGKKFTNETGIQTLDYNYAYSQSIAFEDTSGDINKIVINNITMIDEYGEVMSHDNLLDMTIDLVEGKVTTNLDLKGISKEEAKAIAQKTLDNDSAGHLYSIPNIEDGENGYWIAEFKHDVSGSGYKMRINKFSGEIRLHLE